MADSATHVPAWRARGPRNQPSRVPRVTIDRSRLQRLLADERAAYAESHLRSAAAYADAKPHLLGGVPMTWMNMAAGGFPLYLKNARAARVTDVDGREYVDFALGDTGAMAGHSPAPTVEAIVRRVQDEGGITA